MLKISSDNLNMYNKLYLIFILLVINNFIQSQYIKPDITSERVLNNLLKLTTTSPINNISNNIPNNIKNNIPNKKNYTVDDIVISIVKLFKNVNNILCNIIDNKC